jgi:hypothetical protein
MEPTPEQQIEDKKPWTAPVLKKMDIAETAISQGVADDLDGFS